jgi:predicted MFS family arabinose efflux permease
MASKWIYYAVVILSSNAASFQTHHIVGRLSVAKSSRAYSFAKKKIRHHIGQHQYDGRGQFSQHNVKYSSPEEENIKSSSLQDILILVIPLLLVYISNQWSRFSISYLVDFPTPSESTNTALLNPYNSMNINLGFTENQYGLLASTAFTILFALSSLIAGNFADRYDRKILTLVSCTVWALATLSQSVAHSYEEVLVARFVMGGACAFAVPAGYSLIADRISEDRAALANSIYASGVYLGGSLASLSILLDDMVGWRGALAIIGWYGLFSVAVSAVMLPFEGMRNEKQSNQEEVVGEDIKTNAKPSLTCNSIEILSTPQLQCLMLAAFFRYSAGLIIAIWAPTYYKQVFPHSTSEFAVVNAFIKGALGMTSGIVGGSLAGSLQSWIANQQKDSAKHALSIMEEYFDDKTILLLVPIISSLLAVPTWYFATHTTQGEHAFDLAMIWLAMEYLVAECWFGPTITLLQSSVESSMRGTAQGIFVLVGALGNISPALLGWMYGNQSFELSLADLLGYGVCGGYFASCIFFIASVGEKR